MQILDVQDFGERAADVLQLLLGVDVGIARSDVVHIGDQHQPAFFGFAVVEPVLAVLLFYHLADLRRVQLIEERKAVLQKQKNALVMGRSSDMFDEFGILVIGNGR